jgi:selenocysteine lyase/cysteine desulfurase
VLDKVHPTWVGSDSMVHPEDYLNYDFTFASGAKRFEPGTYSTIGVAGALAAVELILEQGIGFIQDRILSLTDAIREGARSKGWRVYSPWEVGERSGIVSIFKPGVDPHPVQQRLAENKILTSVRAGRLRLAPHYYLSESEIYRAIEWLP